MRLICCTTLRTSIRIGRIAVGPSLWNPPTGFQHYTTRGDRPTNYCYVGAPATTDDAEHGAPGPCDRCGGPAERTDDGGVPVFECADYGNVLGLATADTPDGEAADAAPSEHSDGLSAETVTATDGSLDRLLGLLDAEAGEEPRIAAERLLVDVGSTTIEITGTEGGIELRERRED